MQGRSPDQESIGSGTKRSSVSSGGRPRNQEFFYKFVDSDSLTEKLVDWFETVTEDCALKQQAFDVPFELIELQKFDYALEGISFQQLTRMPNAVHASTSDAVEATAYLAIEDFLHAGIKGLWEAFWSQDEPMPFSVACLYNSNMKFYQAEQAIANGRLGGLCGTGILLNNSRHPHGKWDHVLELALLRPDVGGHAVGSDRQPSPSVLGEALFYALRMLLARSLSRLSFFPDPCTVFVLLVDSQYGGVVKVEGDVNKLKFDLNNVYECAAEWVKNHSRISVSPIDRIWNKLGNANWGDIGALQVLFATFHCIMQFAGMPKHSVEDLAADHSSRLQTRRVERQLGDTSVNGNGVLRYPQRSVSPEIVEVEDDSVKVDSKESMISEGTILWLEDSDWQKGYQIKEVINTSELTYFIASHLEDPGKNLFLYVGSHPSQLEPAWEDMNLWYQVQRQTKVLTIMKQRGLSSKYLPQLSASGRIIHPGHCGRPSSGGNCDHPWCGTPILVTSPVGETVAEMVRSGQFGSEEAIRCCHDCLSALSAVASAGIRHGEIRPENVICVKSGVRHPYFVLIGWGHAILEDRDRPAMNLHFSSTYALQEGKLCSASDAESLVYMLYYSCGGVFPDLDSVEGALLWPDLEEAQGNMSVWLVSVPNEGNSSSETTFLSLKAETASSRHDYADCVRVELPSDLLVGTLDSLMALSDDLNRVDMVIESVVRKIERQFHDLNKGDQALTVDGVPVERYLGFFSWDEAKHPHRRPLPEIVSIIQSSVGKIEEELKQLSTRYSEKKQQLIGLQRKKGGNLMVANLNDVLTPDVVSTSDFVNTEYLQTLVVVVPKNLEEQWLLEYAQIGDQIAEYGPKGNRGNVRGSPVVPGSSRKLMEEGDSAVYTVTLLKGQYQPGFVDKEGNFEPGTTVDYVEDFKTRAKEKRFIVREFNFDPTSHASNEEAIAELEVEVDRLWSALIRWCKAHFGETFIAWMHIKMIRVFVESVLRYGLPVNFVVAMYKPHSGKDKKLRSVLSKKYAHLQPAQFSGLEEGSSGSSQVEYYPYVTNAFNPLSTT